MLFKTQFASMKDIYSEANALLIVSNSSGTASDVKYADAKILERNTGVSVFRHRTKKPGCGKEVFRHLQASANLGITHPGQVVVIGDRLLTDVVMANLMGSWAVWIKDGVVPERGLVSQHPIRGLQYG